MMQAVSNFIHAFDNLVWGIPMLVLLLGTGIFLSARLGFLQFRRFGFIMKQTVGRLFSSRNALVAQARKLLTPNSLMFRLKSFRISQR